MAEMRAQENKFLTLTIDGHTVTVPEGTTIWEAARQSGIAIPVLCHDPRLQPVAVCRVCAVEVKGARVAQAACIRQVETGMEVQTQTEKIERARKMLVELLLADHPVPCTKHKKNGNCELELLGEQYGLLKRGGSQTHPHARQDQPEGVRLRPRIMEDGHDPSSPVIAVDHNACILCDRCIRGCDDIQNNEVIGRTGKGAHAHIGFDLNSPMGRSTCVSCGECASVCPTGALFNKPLTIDVSLSETKAVDSVCPYCGVGCAITYHVKDNKIVQVSGRESPVNHGRLCVKGRYGFDYALHPQRLTVPLIRRPEFYPKGPLSQDVRGEDGQWKRKPGGIVDYAEVLPAFREATWEEALDLVARKLKGIRDQHGPGALAGFGSAKCSNEEAYLFQKLVRAVFGTNNVDHCTRLCHASSVAALQETIGSGAVSNVFGDVQYADVAIVIGSNATENHPVAATFFKQAAERGTTLIVIDPRRPALADHAKYYVRYRPGTDVAFLNGLMHVIIAEDMTDPGFIAKRTENFAALQETVKHYTPELVEQLTGVPAEQVRTIARAYGRAKNAMIFWGMGISQHTTGTDNARCLISLCLMTGNIGRPGTGLHPLRGQNNVQGASDSGLIPMVYTDYQPVADPGVREKFEKAWGVSLDPKPGLTVVEIAHGALHGTIKGMYMMGENPFLSDPNINKVRRALASLEFLAVQDIFLTETAEFADVILPAASFPEKEGTFTNTDRRVQLSRKAIESPGQARPDWQIICEISNRMGYPMRYHSPEEVFRELAALSPNLAGLSYARLGTTGELWPCPDPDQPAQEVLFAEDFPKGRGKFVPAEFAPAKELPDTEFPFVLNTGRVLEHWHTGTMTRRSKALDAIEPEPFVEIHPEDLYALGMQDGDFARVTSRRGAIVLKTRIGVRTQKGSVFIPFHFREAAANLLTNDVLDPYGKIPEFKFCAVKVEKVQAEVRESASEETTQIQ
ncbi:MAG TPA: formate dehydrogenase subunit alpha [Candidatus Binatia bacterium]|nr:formate dehydrogenase subunit alpha [Candidatus Binatia bacterium]